MMLPAVWRLDCHVHLLGDGSSGSGCWLQMRSVVHRLMVQVLVRLAGLPPGVLRGGLDEAVEERLVAMVDGSSLDGAVLLAQDVPHHGDGTPLPERGAFFVPNRHLLAVCARHSGKFLPAVSIHPGRRDAMDELERCLAAGARILKLLPNCLNVDYSLPRYRPFWEMMARHGMWLLSHTGGEMSLPVMDARFADPRMLRYPLDCGVRVIAAHCAGRSGLWDADYTQELLAMFGRWPGLYGDSSALCTPVRAATLRHLMDPAVLPRLVHGSDFPIAVGGFGPWRCGHIDRATWRRARDEKNPLERDVLLKRAMGFGEDHFTRLAGLLTAESTAA